MEIVDAGVLEGSFMDFTIPTDFAKRALYYIPQYGHFHCIPPYDIQRESLDWLLLAYIHSGSLYWGSDGYSHTAPPGSVLLLDCRTPHRYYCRDSVDFSWLHFSGSSSNAYAELLCRQGCAIIQDIRAAPLFRHILTRAQEIPGNEHLISSDLHLLLGRMASPQSHTGDSEPLSPALEYIRRHFDEPVEVGQLAAQCGLSTSHFIRSFQRLLGHTPHEYLVAYRLMQANQLLLTNAMSMEQIAERCGFHSASHFARAFRRSNGISPSEFRGMRF